MRDHVVTRDVPLPMLCAGLALSVCLADLLLPINLTTSLAYVAVVCLAARFVQRHCARRIALGCIGLTLLGWLAALPASLGWLEVANRAGVVSALWWVMSLARHRRDSDTAQRQPRTPVAWEVPTPTDPLEPTQTSSSGAETAPQAATPPLKPPPDWLDVTLASLGEAVITADTHLTVMFFNQAAEELTGWLAREAQGHPLTTVLHLLDEATRQPLAIPLDRVVQEGAVIGLGDQTLLRRADGHMRAIAGGATPIRNAQGQAQGLVLVVRDVTVPRRREAQLRQNHKLAAVGTLAGGIAHEFNNSLAAIIGFTELTVEEVSPGSQAWHNLQRVLQAGLRAQQVVAQLLAFSRLHPPVREPVQLDRVIRDALPSLRASLPATITLQYYGKPGGGPVLADPTQMHHLIVHLGANARDAMRETGGRLEISLDTVPVLPEATESPYLAPGPYVRLRVRDTGCGMPPEVQERMFEPFFTTKEVGAGRGLGLATVHGIVTSHGGAITVSTRCGRGTTFTVYLPQRRAIPKPATPLHVRQLSRPLPEASVSATTHSKRRMGSDAVHTCETLASAAARAAGIPAV